jgi:hypothetical protein
MGTRATAPASAREPEPQGPQARRYGVPSPALLALADRGLTRFLEADTPAPTRAPADDGTADHRDGPEERR